MWMRWKNLTVTLLKANVPNVSISQLLFSNNNNASPIRIFIEPVWPWTLTFLSDNWVISYVRQVSVWAFRISLWAWRDGQTNGQSGGRTAPFHNPQARPLFREGRIITPAECNRLLIQRSDNKIYVAALCDSLRGAFPVSVDLSI